MVSEHSLISLKIGYCPWLKQMTGHARDGTSRVSFETITQTSNSLLASNIAESHTLQITQHKLNGSNY